MSAIAPLKHVVKSTYSAVSRWRVPCVTPTIARSVPHDSQAFTQGLAYHDGLLYESCGCPPVSSLTCRSVADWEVRKRVLIPHDFAEGIAICDDRLYQLSWKLQTARVYRLPDLKQVDEVHYEGEGWGLCSANGGLLMSNGTGTLTYRDAQFRPGRSMRVTLNRLPTRRLNDLECVADAIYANVLFRSEILEISAIDGRVVRIIDCSALTAAANPANTEHVLNGICYNPDNDTFFVAGKCWNLMFEVQIPPRAALPS